MQAVIDIGTNTLLLLVVDARMRRVVDLCRFGRLGKGLDATGKLAEEAIVRSLEICREYRRVMDEHGITRPAVIGTQALREATNAAEFVEPAEDILGAKIEIIGGEREAELAALSVVRTFPELANERYVVVDVGGGSTEFIAVAAGKVQSAVSVKIGAVRMTERHLRGDPPGTAELRALQADIDQVLAPLELPARVPIVGTAGTATTLAAVQLGLATYDPDAVTGLRISPATLGALYKRLAAASVTDRKAIPGIEPQRADVIAAGVAIYSRAVARIDAPVLITCDRGIRWGLAYECSAGAR